MGFSRKNLETPPLRISIENSRGWSKISWNSSICAKEFPTLYTSLKEMKLRVIFFSSIDTGSVIFDYLLPLNL